MRDSPFCPKCGRSIALTDIHCPSCAQELDSSSFIDVFLLLGAIFGTLDGILYALWEESKLNSTFHGGRVGGALLGAVIGTIVLGGILFAVCRPILRSWHGNVRDYREGDVNTAEWQALSRTSRGGTFVFGFLIALVLHALAAGAYYYFRS